MGRSQLGRNAVRRTGAGGGGGAGNVSQIVAGTNITISPAAGTGIVTINALSAGGVFKPLLRGPLAADIVVALTDYTVIADSAAAARAVTLPDAATCQYQVFVVKRSGANDVTVSAVGGDTIDGSANQVLGDDGTFIVVQSDGSNYWVIG